MAIREEVSWLPPCERAAPDLEEMKSWMVLGKRKLRLDDENQFCDPSVLEQVLRCKVSVVYRMRFIFFFFGQSLILSLTC